MDAWHDGVDRGRRVSHQSVGDSVCVKTEGKTMIKESPLTRYSLLNMLYREATYRERAAQDRAAGGKSARGEYLQEKSRRVRILEALSGYQVEGVSPT